MNFENSLLRVDFMKDLLLEPFFGSDLNKISYDELQILGESDNLLLHKMVKLDGSEYYYLMFGELTDEMTNIALPDVDSTSIYDQKTFEVKCNIRSSSSPTKGTLVIFVDRDTSFNSSDLTDFQKVFIISQSSLFLDSSGKVMFHESERIEDEFSHSIRFHKVKAHDIFVKCSSFQSRGGETDSINIICQGGDGLKQIVIDGESYEGSDEILKLSKIYLKVMSMGYGFALKNLHFLSTTNLSSKQLILELPTLQDESYAAKIFKIENVTGVDLKIPDLFAQSKLVPKNFNNALSIQAETILLGEFQASDDLEPFIKLKAQNLIIQPFIMPRGKFEIDAGIWVNFTVDRVSHFTCRELLIKIAGTEDDIVEIPRGFDRESLKKASESMSSIEMLEYSKRSYETIFEFHKVLIDTNVGIKFRSKLFVHEDMQILNSKYLSFDDLKVGSASEDNRGTFVYQSYGRGNLLLCGNTEIGTVGLKGQINLVCSENTMIRYLFGQEGVDVAVEGMFKSNYVSLNTELDPSHLPRDDFFGFVVNHTMSELSKNPANISVGQLVGKVTRLDIRSAAEFGSIKIQPVSDSGSVLIIDPGLLGSINIGEFIATCKLAFDRETGAITIVMDNSRAVSGGDVYAHFANTHVERYVLLHSGQKITLGGAVKAAGIAIISERGDVHVAAELDAPKVIAVSKTGSVHANKSIIGSEDSLTAIMVYAAKDLNISGVSLTSGKDVILYALTGHLLVIDSKIKLKGGNLTIISESGDLMVSGSSLQDLGGRLLVGAGGNIRVSDSSLMSSGAIVKTLKDLVLSNSNMQIKANSMAVITEAQETVENGITARLGMDVGFGFSEARFRGEVLSIFSENEDRSLSKFIFEKITTSKIFSIEHIKKKIGDDEAGSAHIIVGGEAVILGSNIKAWNDLALKVEKALTIATSTSQDGTVHKAEVLGKRIFIDAEYGFVLGADIKGDDYVQIKIREDFAVLPVLLYNELLLAGGFSERGVKVLASKIEAGLVDIEAGKFATFMETIIKATQGSIKADYVTFFKKEDTIKHIKVQQERMRELSGWFPDVKLHSVDDQKKDFVGVELEFAKRLDIQVMKGHVDTGINYKSHEVHLTQEEGSIYFDEGMHFDKLYVDAKRGSVLFGTGIKVASSSVSGNVVMGNELFVSCDSCEILNSQVIMKDKLKIIAKDSVFVMPLSMFKAWTHFDTLVTEGEARSTFLPKIAAEVLEIDAGKFISMMGAAAEFSQLDMNAEYLNIERSKLTGHTVVTKTSSITNMSGNQIDLTQMQQEARSIFSTDNRSHVGVEVLQAEKLVAIEGDTKSGSSFHATGQDILVTNSDMRSRVSGLEATEFVSTHDSDFSGDKAQISGDNVRATSTDFKSSQTIIKARNTASLIDTTHLGKQTMVEAHNTNLEEVTSRQELFSVMSQNSTNILGGDFRDSVTQVKSGSSTHITNSDIKSVKFASESKGKTIVTDSHISGDTGHIRASELVLVDSVKGVQKGVQGNNSSKVKVDFSKAAYIDVDHDLDLRHNFGGRENLHLRQRHGDIVLDEDFHAASEHFSLNLDNGDLVLNAKKAQHKSESSMFGAIGKWLGLGSSEIEEEAKGLTFSGDGDMQINVKNFISHGGKIVGKGYVAVKAQGDIKLLPITVTKTVKSFSGKMTETTAKQIISEINAGRVALDAGGRIDAIGSLIDAAGGIKLKAVEGVNLASAVEIFEKQVVTEGQKRFWLFGDQDKTTERTYNKTHIMPTLKSQGDVIIEVSKGDLTTEGLDVSGAENFKIHVSEGNVTMKAVKDIHIYDKNEVKHHILSFSSDKGFSCMGDTKVEQHFYGEAVHPTIVSVGSGFYGYAKGKLVMLEPRIDASKVHLYAPEGVVLESVPEYSYAFTKITETGFKVQLKSGAHEKVAKIKPQITNDGGEQKSKSSDEVRDIMRAAGSISVEAGFYHTEEELREQRVKFNKGHVRTSEMVIKTSGDFVTKGVDIDSGATFIAAKNWFDTAVESRVSTEYKASEEFVGFKAGVEIGALKLLEKGYNLGQKMQKLGGRGDHMINAASDGYGVVRSGANTLQGVNAGKPISAGVNFKVSHEEEQMTTSSGEVHGNQHNLGEAVLRIEEMWRTEASNIDATNMDVIAKRFEAVTRESHAKQTSSSMSFNFEIPIGTPGASSLAGEIGADLSVSMNASETCATTHTGGTIKVQGKLKMDVKDGKVIGTQIEADIVDISAQNLLVESVQDTMKSSSRGFSMSIDPTELLGGEMPNPGDFVKGLYGEGGSGKAATTNNLGSIVGKAATKIVVQDTLTMAGGLIANASRDEHGELTHKGEAQVKAANLIVEKLHDYDEGITLGLGINPVSSTSKSAFGSEVRTKFALKDQSRDMHSALIGLQVSVDGRILGSENLKSTYEPAKMQGTDIDLDVTFASVDFSKLRALGEKKQVTQRSKILLEQDLTLSDEEYLDADDEEFWSGDETEEVDQTKKKDDAQKPKPKKQATKTDQEEQKSDSKTVAFGSILLRKDPTKASGIFGMDEFCSSEHATDESKAGLDAMKSVLWNFVGTNSAYASGGAGNVVGPKLPSIESVLVGGKVLYDYGTKAVRGLVTAEGATLMALSAGAINQYQTSLRLAEKAAALDSMGGVAAEVFSRDQAMERMWNAVTNPSLFGATDFAMDDARKVEEELDGRLAEGKVAGQIAMKGLAETKKEVREEYYAKTGKKIDPCFLMKGLEDDELIYKAVDVANLLYPGVFNQHSHLFVYKPHHEGTVKHAALRKYLEIYQDSCNDKRFDLEEKFINHKKWESGDPLKGSIRVDIIKTDRTVAWDAKFGLEGISQDDQEKFIKHVELPGGGSSIKLKEVRPGGNDSHGPGVHLIMEWLVNKNGETIKVGK